MLTAVDLDVRLLSGTIGAEIRGLDLHRPLDPDTLAAVRAVWLDRKVVFFPGACLSPDQHVAFARQFGTPTPAHPLVPGIDGYPEVFEIDYQAAIAKTTASTDPRAYRLDRGTAWHTDVTFAERPPMGSILNAVTIPPAGGDTMWSDQVSAYEGLSPSLRSYLDGLTAVHTAGTTFGGNTPEPVEHPVVCTHPETGRRSLFVNQTFTSHIKELNIDESDALLGFLYRHSTRPEYVIRYHWTPGDVGFWDNRSTQHSVAGDYGPQPRVIQRVTLAGERPS